MVFLLAGTVVFGILLLLARLSFVMLGSLWPAVAVYGIAIFGAMAVALARDDVEAEKRDQARIHNQLTKD